MTLNISTDAVLTEADIAREVSFAERCARLPPGWELRNAALVLLHFCAQLSQRDAEIGRLRECLNAIQGGCFPDAGNLAIAGAWQTMFLRLQEIARAALTPSSVSETEVMGPRRGDGLSAWPDIGSAPRDGTRVIAGATTPHVWAVEACFDEDSKLWRRINGLAINPHVWREMPMSGAAPPIPPSQASDVERAKETSAEQLWYTIQLAHYWINGGYPAQGRDVLRNALASKGNDVGEKFDYDYAGQEHALTQVRQESAREAAEQAARDIGQRVVAEWCAAAFGQDHAASVEQRGLRHVEEAIEASQSAGCDRAIVHKLVDYVFDRPPGDLNQEIGGSGLTLLALAAAAGLSADAEEQREVDRVKSKPLEHFAKRNRVKNEAGFIAIRSSEPVAGKS